ncbi:MAG TPA: hypothetical protein VMZ52_02210, partial [Bryobacteraceae bacterium]|nr:hypothetical protein [Bryobacteraceae bacterium]
MVGQTVSDGVSWSANQSYAYNKLNRLLSAEETGTANSWKETFGYYGWGNRWVDPGPTKTYGLSLDGNQTRYNPYTASYDAENRLTGVTSVGNGSASYSYDGEGRRIKKVAGG